MTEFKELSDEDKRAVMGFIVDHIQKHFKEHQVYTVETELIDDDPGIELNEGTEEGEADITDVWYECAICDETDMDEWEAIYHAMGHLGLREGPG